jgi:hypothetical protein
MIGRAAEADIRDPISSAQVRKAQACRSASASTDLALSIVHGRNVFCGLAH